MASIEWVQYLSVGDLVWGPHPRHEFLAYRVIAKNDKTCELMPLPDMLAQLDSAYAEPLVNAASAAMAVSSAKTGLGVRGRSGSTMGSLSFFQSTPLLKPEDVHGNLDAYVVRAPLEEVGENCILIDNQLKAPIPATGSETPKQLTKLQSLADMVNLNTLAPATVLHNVRARFFDQAIYTRVSSILISVNPYRDLMLYTEEVLNKYRYKLPYNNKSASKAASMTEHDPTVTGAIPLVHVPVPPVERDEIKGENPEENKHSGDHGSEIIAGDDGLPPHIFALCRDAYAGVVAEHRSQSVLISGESGAGKSEATKLVLRYVCTVSNSGESIRSKLTSASPVLEMFGNAKTVMNDNSSRFGKWIQIDVHVANRPGRAGPSPYLPGQVIGGRIVQYLLEESRVVMHAPSERNYHIFYALLRPASFARLAELEKSTQPSTIPDSVPEESRREITSSQTFSRYANMSPLDFAYLNPRKLKDPADDIESLLPTQQGRRIESGAAAAQAMDDDDSHNFADLLHAMDALDFSPQTQRQVMDALLGILHLGNVRFFESSNASSGVVTEDDESDKDPGAGARGSRSGSALRALCSLFGLDIKLLTRCMVERNMASGRGSVLTIRLNPEQAADARDALAKNLYSRLFDWIVYRINMAIQQSEECKHAASSLIRSINFLDIYGFEIFENNSLEQLFINYANEKLQQHFVRRVFKMELDIYERNGLSLKNIPFFDNQACLDLIEHVPQRGALMAKSAGLPPGLLSLLNEEINVPRGSDLTLFEKASKQFNNNHPHFSVPLSSGADSLKFTIHHYAAPVTYDMDGFLAKNRRRVPDDLIGLMKTCGNEVIRQLYDEEQIQKQVKQQQSVTTEDDTEPEPKPEEKAPEAKAPEPVPAAPAAKVSGLAARFLNAAAQNTPTATPAPAPVAATPAKKMESLCMQFRSQLNRLVESIERTDTHFVRCIKPNLRKRAGLFDSPMVLRQLRTSGVMDAIRVRQAAYPNRATIPDFLRRFTQVVIHGLPQNAPLLIPEGITSFKPGISVGEAFKQVKVHLRKKPEAAAAGKVGADALAHQLTPEIHDLARAVAWHMLQTLCPVNDPELIAAQRKMTQPQGSSGKSKGENEDNLEIWQVGKTHAFWRPITENRLQAAAEKTLAQAALKIQARYRAWRVRKVFVELIAARRCLTDTLTKIAKPSAAENDASNDKLTATLGAELASEVATLASALSAISNIAGHPTLPPFTTLAGPWVQSRALRVAEINSLHARIIHHSLRLFGSGFSADVRKADALLAKAEAAARELSAQLGDLAALIKILQQPVSALARSQPFEIAPFLKQLTACLSTGFASSLFASEVGLSPVEDAAGLASKRATLGIDSPAASFNKLKQMATFTLSSADAPVSDIVLLYKLVNELAPVATAVLPQLEQLPSLVAVGGPEYAESCLLGAGNFKSLAIDDVRSDFSNLKALAQRVEISASQLESILSRLVPASAAASVSALTLAAPALARVSKVAQRLAPYHMVAAQALQEAGQPGADKIITAAAAQKVIDIAATIEGLRIPPATVATSCRPDIAFFRGMLARERAGAVIDGAVSASTGTVLPVLLALLKGVDGVASATSALPGLTEASQALQQKIVLLSTSTPAASNADEEKAVAQDMEVLAQLNGAIAAPTTEDAAQFAGWITSGLEPAVRAHLELLTTIQSFKAPSTTDELHQQFQALLDKLNKALTAYQAAKEPNAVAPHDIASAYSTLSKAVFKASTATNAAFSAVSAVLIWLNQEEPQVLAGTKTSSVTAFGPAAFESVSESPVTPKAKALATTLQQVAQSFASSDSSVLPIPFADAISRLAECFNGLIHAREDLRRAITTSKSSCSGARASPEVSFSSSRLALVTEIHALSALKVNMDQARRASARAVLALKHFVDRFLSVRTALFQLGSGWSSTAPPNYNDIAEDVASAASVNVGDLEKAAGNVAIGDVGSALDIDGDVVLAIKLIRLHQTHIRLIAASVEFVDAILNQTLVVKPGTTALSVSDALSSMVCVTATNSEQSWLNEDDAYDLYIASLPGFFIRPDASELVSSACDAGRLLEEGKTSASAKDLPRGIYSSSQSYLNAITTRYASVSPGSSLDASAVSKLLTDIFNDTALCAQMYEREVTLASGIATNDLCVAPAAEKKFIQAEMKVHEAVAVANALADIDASNIFALELDASAMADDSEAKGETMGTNSRKLVPPATAAKWAQRYATKGSSSLAFLLSNAQTNPTALGNQKAGDVEAQWARTIMFAAGAGATLTHALLSRVASARIKSKLVREHIVRTTCRAVSSATLNVPPPLPAPAITPADQPAKAGGSALSALSALKATLAARRGGGAAHAGAPAPAVEPSPATAPASAPAPAQESARPLASGVTALRISRNRGAVSATDAAAAAAATAAATNASAVPAQAPTTRAELEKEVSTLEAEAARIQALIAQANRSREQR